MRKVFKMTEPSQGLPKVSYGKVNVQEFWSNGYQGIVMIVGAGVMLWFLVVQLGIWPSAAPTQAANPAASPMLKPDYASLLDVGEGYFVDPDTKDLLQAGGDGVMVHTSYSCANIAGFDLWVTSKVADVKSRCVDLGAQPRTNDPAQHEETKRADCGYSFKKAVELYDQGNDTHDWCSD